MQKLTGVRLALCLVTSVSALGCGSDSEEPETTLSSAPASEEAADGGADEQSEPKDTSGKLTPQARCLPYGCGQNHNRRLVRQV
jgi:hypothetical protein